MGQLAENNVYLSIDSVVITAEFKEVSLDVSNSSQDTTMGAGVDWMQRAPGLNDMKGTINIGYDSTAVQSIIQHIAPGQVVSLEYGPESNVSGKPRHVQNVLVETVSHGLKVDKSPVTFALSIVGADAPSVNMFAGAVYS
jgi:hypothetical protein